jgi:hypothetical protein
MKKVNAPQYEFSALPFNLSGEEAIDGAAEQARIDAEAQAHEEALAGQGVLFPGHEYKPIGTGECWTCGESFSKHL